MIDWVLFNNRLPLSTYSTQLVPYYKGGKLKNGTNRSVWEVDFYETSTPSAQIAADKLIINCMNDTVQFVDHSAISSLNTTWEWSFPGGTPATSSEQNPQVVYSEEGTYDVYLTVTDDYGVDEQVINDLINYTNDPLSMEGFDCDGSCQEGFLNATLIAMDSYGDGWNGNSLSILVDDVLLVQKTLSSGYYEEFELCLPSDPNNCVEIIVQEGGWPEEVSWTILDENDNEIIEGESPWYTDLNNSCPVYGCTDPNAINYDPNANTDDGNCCLGAFYTIIMEDSYGDGWNGNTLMIDNYEIELEDGFEGEEIICLSGDQSCFNIVCDGGDWQYEVAWTIYNQQGDLITSGGAPYTGCFLEGCTDPIACNYNLEATNDNGLCEYPDENGDCNSIALENLEEIDTPFIIITDIIGRQINSIQSGQIYLINNEDGTTEKKINFK